MQAGVQAIATVRSATLLRRTSTTTIGEIPRGLSDEVEIVLGIRSVNELCARNHLSVANGRLLWRTSDW